MTGAAPDGPGARTAEPRHAPGPAAGLLRPEESVRPWWRSRWATAGGVALAFLVLVGIYVATGNPRRGGDHFAAALTSWAIATTGSADVGAFHPVQENLWLFASGDEVLTNRFAGVVLVAVPFYAAASLGTDGFTMWPGIVAVAVCAALATLLMAAALMPLGRRVAVGAAAFFAFGTATWAVSADTQWSHGPAQAALAGAVLALCRGRLGLAGLGLGLAVMVRPHLAVAALAVGLWMAAAARSWLPALRVGLGTVPGVLGLMTYNAWVHGRFWPTNGLEQSAADVPWGDSGGAVGLAALPGNLAGTLASPGRGILVLYPVLVLLAFWLPAAWRRASTAERAAAVGGLAYLLAQLVLNRYSGGWWFFGSRLTIEPLTLAFPLLVRAWVSVPTGRWRTLAWVLLVWTALTHALGAISEQPEVEGRALSDPWTFYDPWVVAVMRGPGVTALVLLGGTAVVLAVAWLLSRWRPLARLLDEPPVATPDATPEAPPSAAPGIARDAPADADPAAVRENPDHARRA